MITLSIQTQTNTTQISPFNNHNQLLDYHSNGQQVASTSSNTNTHNGHSIAGSPADGRLPHSDDDKRSSETIKTWSKSVLSSLTSPFLGKTHHTQYTTASPYYHQQQQQNGYITTSGNHGDDSSYHQVSKSDIHTVDSPDGYDNHTRFIPYNTNNSDTIVTLPERTRSTPSISSTDSAADVTSLLPTSPSTPAPLFQRFVKEHAIWIPVLSIFYFTWFIFVVGIMVLHIIVYFVTIILYFFNDKTRRFVLALFIYLIYVLVYDSMRVVPNYLISNIHTEDVYNIEKKLFGIYSNKRLVTFNEYFYNHHIGVLDVLTGVLYLNWIPIPLLYSFYLYRYKRKRDYLDFALTFLLTNIIGFIIYYIVPTAPPWYIELYGFEIKTDISGNPAGFTYFEQITGFKIFSSMYAKNANVFAAIPSLHAAYPLLCVLYGNLSKKLWLQIFFVLFTLGIWFSAVYSRHHYVLDVLLGATCSLSAYLIYKILSTKVPAVIKVLNNYEKII
ncbi:unnamed protein product [Didymodactylos carnosus]|uniref:Inositolphosphotransferase Aur1/Ipt1 domain-containing protein n=1 Tax=Didymodactylos carnosus TaxID=1234261 RepID=A0A8S2DKZ9_9BILA|nr:unnamed protein product [Didymodactylos carnosus]CAF3696133.1 unnamed protein product [Didymodactylos carnosus]